MTGIKNRVKVTILEAPYYAQNGGNGSSVGIGGPFLPLACLYWCNIVSMLPRIL